jgi:hypothetical protein
MVFAKIAPPVRLETHLKRVIFITPVRSAFRPLFELMLFFRLVQQAVDTGPTTYARVAKPSKSLSAR